MNLCLGTVQFGLDYGIAGQNKPSVDDCIKMLDYATQNGITYLDTANSYGTAEDVVGAFLQKKTLTRNSLTICSKVRPNILDDVPEEIFYNTIKDNMENSLQRLHTDYLDTYLFHSARYVFSDAKLEALYRLKKEGYVKKVGVSVYKVEEARRGVLSEKVDFLQLPYSIFDQRMLDGGIFDMPEVLTTEIHSRSAFIQGLIIMQENEIPQFLARARPIVKKITEICSQYKISRVALAMAFVQQQVAISHLVFGVDNLSQLKEDMLLFNNPINKDVIVEISKQFKDIDTDIIMPSLWSKK